MFCRLFSRLWGLGFIYDHQNEPILTDWAFKEARRALAAEQMQTEEKMKQEINESENNTDEAAAKSGKTKPCQMGSADVQLWQLFPVFWGGWRPESCCLTRVQTPFFFPQTQSPNN